MTRAYDNIPRQGEHLDEPIETEPTGSVRAQDPAHPPERKKATEAEYVLVAEESRNRYRILQVPMGAEIDDGDGFKELARVPVAGDLTRIYGRVPEGVRHSVFESSESGETYSRGEAPSGDWTNEGMFDRVTIFANEDDAEAYSSSLRSESSDDN